MACPKQAQGARCAPDRPSSRSGPAAPGRPRQVPGRHQQGPQPPGRPQTGGPLDRADSTRRVQGPMQISSSPGRPQTCGPLEQVDSTGSAQAGSRQAFCTPPSKRPRAPPGRPAGGPLNRAGSTRQVQTGFMQASSSPRQAPGRRGGPIAIAPGRLAWLDTLIDNIFVCRGCVDANSRGALGSECGAGWGMKNATLCDMKF